MIGLQPRPITASLLTDILNAHRKDLPWSLIWRKSFSFENFVVGLLGFCWINSRWTRPGLDKPADLVLHRFILPALVRMQKTEGSKETGWCSTFGERDDGGGA
jgi:hypothetical protein